MTMSIRVLVCLLLITCFEFGTSERTAAVYTEPGKLFQHVKPNLTAAKGLLCYQCYSVSNQIHPHCDQSIFGLIAIKDKENLQFQCPHYKSAFCFIKIVYLGNRQVTLRGCSGEADKNNNTLKTGCIDTVKMKYCLCDKALCNKENRNKFDFRFLYVCYGFIITFSTRMYF